MKKSVSVKKNVKGTGIKGWPAAIRKEMKHRWQLYLLLVIPLGKYALFNYGPIYGLQIAFKDFRPRAGIWGSEWVGLKWFREFLSQPVFLEIFSNTIILSLYALVVSFPLAVIFALMLNSMRHKKYRGFVENVTYIPHFISVTVFVGIISMLLSPTSGIYGMVYKLFGGEGYPTDFRWLEGSFRHIYVWSAVWQSLGWNTILYTSALASVSPELHEAARIDGASRFKRLLHVDIPAIMPTIAIMLIMRVGSVVSADFQRVYLLQSDINLGVSEVIATYVYKKGLGNIRTYSYGAAIGMFNTVINVILMLIANKISKKVTENEVSLF